MTTIPIKDAGMAGSETGTFTTLVLITGNHPTITTPETVADATVATDDLPAYTVVGRDENGNLVPATWNATPANAVAPIGITTATVLAGTTGGSVPVYRDGGFNPDALTWDASFDTDEKKRLAFEATQPTLIIRKPLFAEGVS